MNRRGYTVIEMLTTSVIVGVLATGFLTVFVNNFNNQALSVNLPTVQENARQMAITVGGALRDAQLCTSTDTGCTLNAAVSGTTASGVTIYSRPSTALVQTTYGISSGNFYKQVGTGAQTVLYSGASMTLTYYQSTGAAYHMGSLNSSSYTPTAATTPNLIAVAITTTVTKTGINGATVTGTYNTLVRLRNSPLKSNAGA